MHNNEMRATALQKLRAERDFFFENTNRVGRFVNGTPLHFQSGGIPASLEHSQIRTLPLLEARITWVYLAIQEGSHCEAQACRKTQSSDEESARQNHFVFATLMVFVV